MRADNSEKQSTKVFFFWHRKIFNLNFKDYLPELACQHYKKTKQIIDTKERKKSIKCHNPYRINIPYRIGRIVV